MRYIFCTLQVELQLTLRRFQGNALGCLSSFQLILANPKLLRVTPMLSC